MSTAQLLVGGAIGLVVGIAVGRNQSARGTGGVATCPITRVSEWMTSKQMAGVLVTSRMDLPRVPLDVDIDAVVTQDTCTVFVPGADGWTESGELTAELSAYLGGPKPPPVTRPTPEGVDIPAGPRPVP